MDIFMEEMRNLFIGQSFDLYWTRFGECPSQEEYLEMVNQSTSRSPFDLVEQGDG